MNQPNTTNSGNEAFKGFWIVLANITDPSR